MRRFVVASQKGGVGKTTTVLNLAAVAAQRGRVLIVDTDPISSIAASLGLEVDHHRPSSAGAPEALRRDILPGVDLLGFSPSEGQEGEELRDILSSRSADYSCALVDCQPWVGDESDEIFAAAGELLAVLRADPLSFRTLPGFLRTVTRLRDERGLQFRGLVLTLPAGEALGGDWERSLRGRFGDAILAASIPWDEAVPEALMDRRPVVTAAPKSVVAEQYRRLAQELELA